MVEDIEGLCAELKFETLIDRKLAPNGKVHLQGAKPADKIPRCGTSRARACGWVAECIRIDGTSPGTPETVAIYGCTLGSIYVNRLTRNQIQIREVTFTSRGISEKASPWGDRETCSCSKAVVDSPVVQHGGRKSTTKRVRKIIGKRRTEVMSHVEITISAE